MELKLNLEYNQLLRLVQQLSERDKEKLVNRLQSELSFNKTGRKEKLQDLILKAPTWNEEQLLDCKATRNHINKSRLI